MNDLGSLLDFTKLQPCPIRIKTDASVKPGETADDVKGTDWTVTGEVWQKIFCFLPLYV